MAIATRLSFIVLQIIQEKVTVILLCSKSPKVNVKIAGLIRLYTVELG
jgi:hypothetical protein